MLFGMRRKVGVPELQCDLAGMVPIFPKPLGDVVRQLEYGPEKKLAVIGILVKCRLAADRFGFPVRHHRPVVLAPRQVKQMLAEAAQRSNQRLARGAGELADRLETHFTKPLLGLGADTPKS